MQPKYDPFSGRIDGIGFEAWKEYDDAFFAWLSNIGKFRAGSPHGTIPVVLASPEKAFAKAQIPLNEGQPDIPLISFYMTTVSLDYDKRGLVPGHILIDKYKKTSDQWALSGVSTPVTLTYSVTLWAKHYYEIRYVAWAILMRFKPNSFIMANGAASQILFESGSDASDLEPGAGADRSMRHDFSFRVEGWLPRQYIVADSIHKVNIGIVEGDDETVDTDEDPNLFPEMTLQDGSGAVIMTEQVDLSQNYAFGVLGFSGPSPGVATKSVDRSYIELGGEILG